MKWCASLVGRPFLLLPAPSCRIPVADDFFGRRNLTRKSFFSFSWSGASFYSFCGVPFLQLWCFILLASCLSVCAEGKTFEFSGGDEGVFPFRVTEFSRRKNFFVMLSLEEVVSLAVEWVRFCSSKVILFG